jgi:hypothetical protein
MFAEKELQGRQTTKTETSFMPHSTPMAPSRTAMPSGAHSSTTPLASRAPLTSSTPYAAALCTMDLSKTSVSQGATITTPLSSIIPTGRTSDIKCHHCHGIGHF